MPQWPPGVASGGGRSFGALTRWLRMTEFLRLSVLDEGETSRRRTFSVAILAGRADRIGPSFVNFPDLMPAKPKPLTEAQFLTFLQQVLSKLLPDHHLRSSIQDAVAKEIRVARDVAAFNQFCEKGSVPDARAETVATLQDQIAATFGSDAKVEIAVPEAREGDTDPLGALGIEIVLPDRTITSELKVNLNGYGDEGDGAPRAPFVPFPVTLPQDAALVWTLARREDLGPDEAGRALAHVEDEFWGSKAGQNFQRKGGEKTFAEFIANVPGAALLEVGLKRHYKEPVTIHSLRQLNAGVSAEEFAASVRGGDRAAAEPKASGKGKPKAKDALEMPDIVFPGGGESDPDAAPF